MFDTQNRIAQIRARLAASTDVQFIAFASDIAFLLNEVGRLEGLLSDAGDNEAGLCAVICQMRGAIAEYRSASEDLARCPNIEWQIEQAQERLADAERNLFRLAEVG